MPTISCFYGILIQMFWNDHAPPHFHALYAEHEALIDIRTLEVIEEPFRAVRCHSYWNGPSNIAWNSWRIGHYASADNHRRKFNR